MELIFATNNTHKLEELSHIFELHLHAGQRIVLKSLKDIGCHKEIPETAETLEGNALQKARYIYNKYGKDCFADDTGLEVEALDGRPGVYSARYAGPGCKFQDNINKLLSEMKTESNRAAQFRTIIALIIHGQEYIFEGEIKGVILKEEHGSKGFGYDPVFLPEAFQQSFAEMDAKLKNSISHRYRASIAMANFLKEKIK